MVTRIVEAIQVQETLNTIQKNILCDTVTTMFGNFQIENQQQQTLEGVQTKLNNLIKEIG